MSVTEEIKVREKQSTELVKVSEEVVSRPNKLVAWFEENKSLLIRVFVVTIILGLMGNAFGYFNLNLDNDFLLEYKISHLHKIRLGRFLQPVVRYILGGVIVLPWVEGIVFLFFTGCTVFLICKVFHYQKLLPIIITAGLFTNNLWVIFITSSCLHDLSSYALAMFLAVLAFSYYVKHKDHLRIDKIVLISLMVICSAALYQAYLSVTVTLIIIHSIVSLFNGGDFKKEIKSLLIIFTVIGIASILYYLDAHCVAYLCNVDLNDPNEHVPLRNLQYPLDILQRIPSAYVEVFKGLFFSVSTLPKSVFYGTSVFINVLNWVLLIFALLVVVNAIIQRKIKVQNLILCLILFLLLPLAMGCIYVFTGMIRILYFSYILYYIFLLEMFKLSDRLTTNKFFDLQKIVKFVSLGMLFVIASNIQLANTAYAKKDLQQQAVLSVMTRVVDKIESMPGYVTGETKVIFIGYITNNNYWYPSLTNDDNAGVNLVANIAGMSDFTIWNYLHYIRYVLNNNMNCYTYSFNSKTYGLSDLENDFSREQIEMINEMPSFPNGDYVQKINNIVVVKLSNI